jgi:hypothetical protein
VNLSVLVRPLTPLAQRPGTASQALPSDPLASRFPTDCGSSANTKIQGVLGAVEDSPAAQGVDWVFRDGPQCLLRKRRIGAGGGLAVGEPEVVVTPCFDTSHPAIPIDLCGRLGRSRSQQGSEIAGGMGDRGGHGVVDDEGDCLKNGVTARARMASEGSRRVDRRSPSMDGESQRLA